MRPNPTYLLILLLTLMGVQANGTVFINEQFEKASLQGLSVLEDSTHSLDSVALLRGDYDHLFKPEHEPVLNFRYSTSTWWIRFKVKNNTIYPQQVVLDIASSNINRMSLHSLSGNVIHYYGVAGFDYAYNDKRVMFGDYYFPITLAPGGEYTFYLKARNSMASLRLPLKLWNSNEFLHSHQRESIGWGIFIGIMMLIALFNFMVYMVLKDRVYLFYFIYVTALLIYQISGKGFMFQYLWPRHPELNETGLILISVFVIVSMLRFSQAFLDMPVNFEKVNPLINGLMLLMLAYIPIWFLRDLSFLQPARMGVIHIFTFTPLIGFVIMLGSVIKGIRRKHWESRIYLVAFAPLILFSIAVALRNNHLLPYYLFLDVRIPLSFSFELIIFSFSLAYRFKLLKDEQSRLLIEMNEQRIQQFKAVIEATENERKRIAEELHDGLGQLLSTAKLNVSSLEDSIEEEDKEQYENSMSLIDEACQEVRSISHNMMPSTLIRLGLFSAIKELADKVNTAGQVTVEVKITGFDNRLEEAREIAIYRIVQEILNNALRYAGATTIKIGLEKKPDGMVIAISDNGKGFNTADISKSKGIGWRNIYSRVDMLGGHISVKSSAGKGTWVKVNVTG